MSTDRTIIHREIQWYQPLDNGWHILNYQDIVDGIIHWKNILNEMANLAPGEKFGVGSSYCDYNYLTAIFAGIELGGKIIVMPSTDSGKKLIGPISTWIYQDDFDKGISDGMTVGHAHRIPWSIFYSFKSRYDTFDHLDRRAGQPTDTVLTTTTSGSSGTPRVVEYSHRLFDDIRQRSIKIFDLKANDRVLHLSNMHHGGTGGVFFLPSLSACRYHYYFDGQDLDKIKELVDLVRREKITKAMFPNNLIVDKFLKELSWLDHDLEIYVNQANDKNWVDLVKQKNIKAIHSLFGSTETLGPIFLNTIRRDSDSCHDVLNYGNLLDDFYSVELHPDHTVVKLKNHHQEVLNDCFDLDAHGNYIFQARSNIIRINGCFISLKTINAIAQETLDKNGIIVPDTITNKIYVVYNSDLTNPADTLIKVSERLRSISPVLDISHSECLELEQFVAGIKISLENIRIFFRKKYNLL